MRTMYGEKREFIEDMFDPDNYLEERKFMKIQNLA